jgi:hypothetical protein
VAYRQDHAHEETNKLLRDLRLYLFVVMVQLAAIAVLLAFGR